MNNLHMEINLGIIDRIIRNIIGLALVYLALYVPLSTGIVWTLTILGCAIMVTAISSFCPIYKLLKISTYQSL